MFAKHKENKVKECGLKIRNEVRASNFLARGPEFLATLLFSCTVCCNTKTVTIAKVVTFY